MLSNWILTFLLSMVPPGHCTYGCSGETAEQTIARYKAISQDLAEVVQSEPPVFPGNHSYAKTSAILASIGYFESALSPRVEAGELRGDDGKSVCLLQLNVGSGKTPAWNQKSNRFASDRDNPADVVPGYSAAELLSDRKNCIRAGLRLVRVSINSCSRHGVLEGLRTYASGSCAKGSRESQLRMGKAVRWFNSHRPGFDDLDVESDNPYKQ
jgi:hypothetical protein